MTLKVIVETCFNWAGFQKGSRRYLANLFALCLQPRGWRGGAHGDSAPRRVFLSCRSPAAPRLAGGRAPVRMLGGLGRRAGGRRVGAGGAPRGCSGGSHGTGNSPAGPRAPALGSPPGPALGRPVPFDAARPGAAEPAWWLLRWRRKRRLR